MCATREPDLAIQPRQHPLAGFFSISFVKKYPPSVHSLEAWWICCEENTSHRAIVNSRFTGIIGRKSGIIGRKSDVWLTREFQISRSGTADFPPWNPCKIKENEKSEK
jgi:hypothetical protein